MGYSTLFWGPRDIPPLHDLKGVINPRHFRVVWPFSWAIAHCFGFVDDFLIRDPRYMVLLATPTLVGFAFFARFSRLKHTIFGSGDGFQGP